jgi:hypothetical protein
MITALPKWLAEVDKVKNGVSKMLLFYSAGI